jgi:hypothetical protein
MRRRAITVSGSKKSAVSQIAQGPGASTEFAVQSGIVAGMNARLAIASLTLLLIGVVPLRAHLETHKGTVIAVEKTGVRVSVVDPKTKKTSPRLFEVDAETKILRGDAVVTFATAKIQKGEAISVTVDHDLAEELALVIRLAPPKS